MSVLARKPSPMTLLPLEGRHLPGGQTPASQVTSPCHTRVPLVGVADACVWARNPALLRSVTSLFALPRCTLGPQAAEPPGARPALYLSFLRGPLGTRVKEGLSDLLSAGAAGVLPEGSRGGGGCVCVGGACFCSTQNAFRTDPGDLSCTQFHFL